MIQSRRNIDVLKKYIDSVKADETTKHCKLYANFRKKFYIDKSVMKQYCRSKFTKF